MIDVTGKILVVDDEINLAEGIKENLVAEGHDVTTVYHGGTALETITKNEFDLILLDVMLPGLDGYSICETIRRNGNNTPVLFLTAKGEADDRVRGLEAGGDDYLPKPFHLKELLARVGAIMRRTKWYHTGLEPGSRLEFAGNEMDFRSFHGKDWNGIEQILPHREAMIFKVLAESAGEVVSREAILEKVWGYDVYPSTRTIDNFIVRLRQKFERIPEEPQHFHTVRGIGYRFTAELEGES